MTHPDVEYIYEMIMRLDVNEQKQLLDLLRGTDEEEPGLGVREPRRPPPDSPGDMLALRLSDEFGGF